MALSNAERSVRWRDARRAAGLSIRPYAKEDRASGKTKLVSDLPFIGVDGEGAGTDDLGRQNYLLLRAGDRELFHNNRRLTTYECLEFLCNLPRKAIAVGFAFNYDATMILRDLSPERVQRIFLKRPETGEGESPSKPAPMRWTWIGDDYGVKYLPKQFFSVCRAKKINGVCKQVPGTARTVYEVFGLFQSSFLKTLKMFDIGNEHLETIERNKNDRSNFETMTDEVRRYNKIECELLTALMEKFRTLCYAGNIRPRTWSGAGKLAEALHLEHKTPKRGDLPLVFGDWPLFVSAAYYGGRFEITRTGYVKGPIYEYDIASAYPHAMLRLPCLVHARWYETNTPPAGSLYVADLSYSHSTTSILCGFPHRNKQGRLAWPRYGNGTYWSVEIEAAHKLGASTTIRKAWVCEPCCSCRQFDWVAELYLYRKKIGKSVAGYPIKLGMNSLYGKLAQRIGTAAWQNFVWAGLITAITRARLMEAAAHDPASIIMLATDGIYSTAPLPLQPGNNLGDWEAAVHDGMFIVQPGLYWGPPKPKTRGVPAGFFANKTADFEQAWAKFLEGERSAVKPPGSIASRIPSLPIQIKNFIGLKLANARGKPETAGVWRMEDRRISFAWDLKRKLEPLHIAPDHVTTAPMHGSREQVSMAYTWTGETVSMAQEFEELTAALPDYVSFSPPFKD